MTMEFEIEIINPAKHPELAAQQVVIELIRAGKIDNAFNGIKALNTYHNLLEKYKALAAGVGVAETVDGTAEREPPASPEPASAAASKAAVVEVKEKVSPLKTPATLKAKTKTSVSASAAKAPAATAKPVAKPKKAKPDPATPKKK